MDEPTIDLTPEQRAELSHWKWRVMEFLRHKTLEGVALCPICSFTLAALADYTRVQLGSLDVIACRCGNCRAVTFLDASILDAAP